MHGLIFETSVWLLAESTRLLPCHGTHSHLPVYTSWFCRCQAAQSTDSTSHSGPPWHMVPGATATWAKVIIGINCTVPKVNFSFDLFSRSCQRQIYWRSLLRPFGTHPGFGGSHNKRQVSNNYTCCHVTPPSPSSPVAFSCLHKGQLCQTIDYTAGWLDQPLSTPVQGTTVN